MLKIIATAALSFCSWCAYANIYEVHCTVSDKEPTTRILKEGDFTVSSSMKDVTVVEEQPYELLVGTAQIQYPDGEVSEQLRLTIKKHGKIAAQSVTDFDPQHPRNVSLRRNLNSPGITCKPKSI